MSWEILRLTYLNCVVQRADKGHDVYYVLLQLIFAFYICMQNSFFQACFALTIKKPVKTLHWFLYSAIDVALSSFVEYFYCISSLDMCTRDFF